ncbi:putative uncharacterized protein DDB_G0282133 [Daktulosphaira vitifoliae]|uniref:putative uncharacterized protein DDB_G0282133 n=1 Tax=Daktulosphaira vitifoliae TaxID=58002 RepID=UPI0021A9D4A9|nr:putative uncharacterized protein DDB_G0282133 [Daktulosphaira vitifoliae]
MGGKKEPSKNRMYEKERRDRLNVSFEELRTVLPISEANSVLGKAEIINHAVDYIRVLQNEKLQESNINRKEVLRLKNRISQLCNKIKYLFSILREAKIQLPKDKNLKKIILKTGCKSKQIKESCNKYCCLKKLKKKPRLLPNPSPTILQNKSIKLPMLTSSNKPTIIFPNGHLIKIETLPVVPQPQILYDIPKILLLHEYKNSDRLIVPKRNDATNTTSVNKRPIPSLASYNNLLKKTDLAKNNSKHSNESACNVQVGCISKTKNKKLVEEKIDISSDKIDKNFPEPLVINDNKCNKNHTIEAIVKDINQEKDEKQNDSEKNILNNDKSSSTSKNIIKHNDSETNDSNNTSNNLSTESTKQNTLAVVNSLNILSDENQGKSMETAKNIMSCFDDIRLPIPSNDFPSDLFSTLNGPVGSHHADSMSPTEAFLLSFPLVSNTKNTNILNETEQSDINSTTPTTILQIGNLESPATELFQKNIEDCEKDHNKSKDKDNFVFNEKTYFNDNYLDTNKKSNELYDFNKDNRKFKSLSTSQSSISSYHKASYNDISSYYKTSSTGSDLWRYSNYNSYDKNIIKNTKKNDKSTSTVFTNNVSYVPYDLNTTTYIDTENYSEIWPHKPKQKKKQNEKNTLVNWMTDKSCQNTYSKKDNENFQKKNNFDVHFDVQSDSKQAFSWSPSKTLPLLPHLDSNMPSTLPTLVGDLALNNSSNTQYDQRLYDCNKKNDSLTIPNNDQTIFNYNSMKSRPINSNFLSVSQLVEQPKTNDKDKGRNIKDYSCVYQNQKTNKDNYQSQTKHFYTNSNLFEQDQSWVRSKYLHDSSKSTNHSAESLIKHQQKNYTHSKSSIKNQIWSNSKQTMYYKTGQKQNFNNNENINTYYNHNSNYLYDTGKDLDKQTSYQLSTNFYTPVTTKHTIPNYIPLPTSFNMTNSSFNKPAQHFAQNTNYYSNSSNVNTLTNFNLSTIFPEINDKEPNNIAPLDTPSKNMEYEVINNYGTVVHPPF